ncbi:hypothetical protein ATO12_17220 [Aquimarina atlantica]|uniref:Uncharacterized protein n=1 Tax=Aquimarina atlantica TaxID=1317122 RepID=A0A023BUH1_9FLAO|nr:hypothetical protein [Aquimarina atlantica]EZH73677.1 hypothetical protein ATO12_17220 [Aquimarina atlantica]
MKKKFLVFGLALCASALAFTISNSDSKEEISGLFVDSDNIAQAYYFGGCVTETALCDPGGGEVYLYRQWINNPQ